MLVSTKATISMSGGAALRLGIDVGSVALKAVVVDQSGSILERRYARTLGRPLETAATVLGEILTRWSAEAIDLAAATGSAGRLIGELLNLPVVNEVICQAVAIRHLYPQTRSLIEMGGQDSKLILLAESASHSPILDFSMNTSCAAGTGSFLDQQAERLGIRIEEEFGRLALKSRSAPRVAGRCSVFAKSDMIHLQQQATPIEDILAGLCLGLVRNLRSNLVRGRELPRPVAFCGGVAANAGVVHALCTVFGLAPGDLIVPECHAFTGAIGAVMLALDERARYNGVPKHASGDRLDLGRLTGHLGVSVHGRHCLAALDRSGNGTSAASQSQPYPSEPSSQHASVDAYLGLDVGSISTKMAVIDADNRVLAKTYLMTAGRPLDAVRRALSEIHRQIDGSVQIRGAATTGSGRYLTGDFVGADLVVNEITAQATAAATLDPEVDTIFEIGGQDSKYISLDRGVVVDFEMNHACAAGTGSFLEEQANRLGVRIDRQFAELALGSLHPIQLGERCTVFIESDLLSHQQQRAPTEDLVAGLCYSIVANYINRVVGHRRIGKRIFFQGGTAFNQGVVAAFEKVVGSKIRVPPHHEVTGAIGAAVLARRYHQNHGGTPSRFRGLKVADLEYGVRSFACDGCSNACEINEVRAAGLDPLYYGSRCDRFNVKADATPVEKIPDLFGERHRLLLQYAGLNAQGNPGRPTIGIPLALANYELLPFWGTLLGQLGLAVVVSPVSTAEMIRSGVEAALATPCFPVKVAYGHVLHLIGRGVDYLWVPSVLNMPRGGTYSAHSALCPYVSALPYGVTALVEQRGRSIRMLQPRVRFQEGRRGIMEGLKPLCSELGVTPRQLRRAVDRAWRSQADFENACRARGRKALEELSPGQRAVVLVSRPYNGCDSGAYLRLPAKLRKLGVLAIPMDFLDLRRPEKTNDRVIENMYWRYGQSILRAAEIIRGDPRLHAVYLSSFSCGPDSFLIGYFKRLMAPRPSLVLEIDEHSADAGVLTRLEAFLDSLNAASPCVPARPLPLYPHPTNGRRRRTLYIPWMGDQAYGLAAAIRAYGQPAEVIPRADRRSLEIGRRSSSGKECLPCIITAGDMLRLVRRPDFDSSRAAFFMPGASGPCRFGQYNCMHKLLLNDMGLSEVPVVSLAHDTAFYEDWGRFRRGTLSLAWYSICAFDLLLEACLAVRPYEVRRGAADALYQEWGRRLCKLIERRPREAELRDVLAQAAADFSAVSVDRSLPRPRIGVVGEIYIRHHDFANNDLLRQLESLGAEATLSGFPEWHYYTNWMRLTDARRAGQWRRWLVNRLYNDTQRRIERRLNAIFHGLVGNVDEPPTEELLELARPYLDPSLKGGEAVLSVGKIIELARRGCHGAINVMPFSCMPSTIVEGVMKRLAAATGGMPVLSISYDGQQDPTLQTRLEAFLHQARAYQSELNDRA